MTQNYYELLGLTALYNIDAATLENNFRTLQFKYHPDRFVTAEPSEKLKSMQLATLANSAYQTLKHPALRAQYLLELHGINAISETNTAMPADFLMQQMEWREILEEAKADKDIAAVENLLSEIRREAELLNAKLGSLIDEQHDYVAATDSTRKLIFIDKVCEDINKVIEQIEN